MKRKTAWVLLEIIGVVCLSGIGMRHSPPIPRTWDIEKLHSQHLPLPDTSIVRTPYPEELYNQLPVRKTYKAYPFYMPGREPKGYYAWLRTRNPEIIFDADSLRTDSDWIRAGEIVYDMPQNYRPVDSAFLAILPEFGRLLQQQHFNTTADGVIPGVSLVVREKGKIELGNFACNNCHTKIMPDGSLLKGGQGDFVFTRWTLSIQRAQRTIFKIPDSVMWRQIRPAMRGVFEAPWVKNETQDRLKKMTVDDWLDNFGTCTGALYRQGTAYGYAVSVPDLFNLQKRKYFDRTGLLQHRDIGDLMRYAALNQNMDLLDDYNGFTAADRPTDPKNGTVTRFSDEQLYARSKYIYSLKAPQNPNPAPKALVKKGEAVFLKQGCDDCHRPPLYSNNELTPAEGFTPPPAHFQRYAITNECVGTDPNLSLYTRRSTGYYKIPSLIGAWNRTAFLHGGYLANLDDMLDSTRLKPDYVPTGFKPPWTDHLAVKGHTFGMALNRQDKEALLAFLRSL
jgi:hypothetical protein